MSIFDRLLKNKDEAPASAPAPVRAKAASEGDDASHHRFMGRDGVADHPEPVLEKGLDAPAMLWVHIQPETQRLLLVSDLGVAQGELLTHKMLTDLQRAGWCEEVAYHAGYDQYWKMPAQESILRAPSLHHIPAPPLNQIKLQTQLVKPGVPRGFWMRVRMRTADEMLAGGEPMV